MNGTILINHQVTADFLLPAPSSGGETRDLFSPAGGGRGEEDDEMITKVKFYPALKNE
ncbi:MAG: hypothetical protein AAFZ15_28235 [Bacteroidota bacterium]